jgi:hypothetical protein
MPIDDNEMEKYLGKFRPRAVRPLETSRPMAMAWMGRLAAAALLLFSVGAGLCYARHERNTPRAEAKLATVRVEARVDEKRANPILLTELVLQDPKRFEEQLEAESQRVLPDLQGQQSTLRVLKGIGGLK